MGLGESRKGRKEEGEKGWSQSGFPINGSEKRRGGGGRIIPLRFCSSALKRVESSFQALQREEKEKKTHIRAPALGGKKGKREEDQLAVY